MSRTELPHETPSSSNEMPLQTRRKVLAAIGAGVTALSVPALFRGSFKAQSAPSGELRTVRPGYFTVATIGEMPLFSMRDNEVVGVEAEMIQRIVERYGLKLAIDVMEWSACLASVPSGRADCVGGNMGWTVKRSRAMLLTDPVYYTPVFVVMHEDKPFTDMISIADLADSRVGTVSGFSFVEDLRRVPDTREVKLYDTTDAAVRDLIAKRLDYAFLDAPILDYLIQVNNSWPLKQVPVKPDEQYPIIGRTQQKVWGLNMANRPLFDMINEGIAWLWETGQIAELMHKYGLTHPHYLKRPIFDARIGVDR
jgi:ABC-type amino acid transport substrate-binding protein